MQSSTPTASRHTRQKSSIYTSIREKLRRPSEDVQSPTNIICSACAQTGHWSFNCDIRCTACLAPGHEAADCPRQRECMACSGWGYMRPGAEEDAASAVHQLQAALAGVRRASKQFEAGMETEDVEKDDVVRRHDSVQGEVTVKDLHDDLQYIAFLTDKVADKTRQLECRRRKSIVAESLMQKGSCNGY